jgi:DNA-binding MarR family transcriptional regulator
MSLVARDRSVEDRRVVFVEITKQGVELLAKLDLPVNDLHKKLLGHMTKAEIADLNRLLTKARSSLVEADQ